MLSMSLREAINQVKNGHISAKELCEKCIERSVKVRELNAFITETPDVCRKQVHNLGSGTNKQERRLNGLPIAVKDNFCTRNVRTSCASKMLDNFKPPYTATVVQRLLDQGSVLVGKTNMDEFAMGCGSTDSYYGPVFNPWRFRFKNKTGAKRYQDQKNRDWDQQTEEDSQPVDSQQGSRLPNLSKPDADNLWVQHTKEGSRLPNLCELDTDNLFIAGGSSGGSAVAVASGACFGALGSDTGGSTRNPASYCGVVGLKPTYGLVSRYGLIPLVNSLDVPGILAKTVDDATLILNTIAGHDTNDSTTVTDAFSPLDLDENFSVKNLHIGIPKEYHSPGLSPEIRQAWTEAADLFEKAGARVTQVSLPHTQHSIITYSVLCACEVASNMARYDGVEYGHRASNFQSTDAMYAQSRHEGFNDVVRGRIFAGNYFLLRENYEKHFLHALKVRRLISNDFKNVFQSGVDVLLTPTTLTDAPSYKWFVGSDNRTRTSVQDVFTQPANMAGVPAVNVPFKLSSAGLPIGLQIIGQNFKDHHMLNIARWMEKEINFKPLDLSFVDSL